MPSSAGIDPGAGRIRSFVKPSTAATVDSTEVAAALPVDGYAVATGPTEAPVVRSWTLSDGAVSASFKSFGEQVFEDGPILENRAHLCEVRAPREFCEAVHEL